MTSTEYFIEIGKGNADLTLSKMFGATCYKTPNGKAAAMIYKDHLVVKLEGKSLEEALASEGAQMFEPMEGRAMNGWVMIPWVRKEEWTGYLNLATSYVKTIAAKEPKGRKKK